MAARAARASLSQVLSHARPIDDRRPAAALFATAIVASAAARR
jgi:hypothetical protein